MSTVLLIDADVLELELFAAALKRGGFHTLAATSGDEGLRLARSRSVDVVVTDLTLPDMSGPDLLCRLRSDNSALPILVAASDCSSYAAFVAGSLGIKCFFEKPVTGETLLTAATAILSATPAGTAAPNGSTTHPVHDDPRVASVLCHIEEHLGSRLSIDALAQLANLSPSRLRQVFRHKTGTPLAQFCRERRLLEACALLSHTRLRISEIAMQVGVPDLPLFDRLFRRRFRMSPTQYRDLTRPTYRTDQIRQLIVR